MELFRSLKAITRVKDESKCLHVFNLNSYLLFKLGDFFTSPDFPIKRNLETIILHSYSKSTTDISAVFMAINL
jgi:hypothetical protein